MVSVRRAAAGAVEPCPAVITLPAGIDVALAELLLHVGIGHAVPDIAHPVGLVADELMTGIELALRRDGEVFRTGAAARDALINARTVVEVDHIMIEGDRTTFLLACEHRLCQLFILRKQDRQVLRGQRRRVAWVADDRFHRKLREAEVREVQDVVGEIRVGVGISAADVIIAFPAALCELLKLRDDRIVAAASLIIHAEAVVHRFAAVDAHDDVLHFAVGEFNHIVVNIDAVGGQREAETLMMRRFQTAAVADEFFDDLPVHQRLAAEEVHLQIGVAAGVFY